MKGNLCVYDHRKDPVVFAISGNSSKNFSNTGTSFTNLLTPSFPVVPIVQNIPVLVLAQPCPSAQNQH